MTSPVGPFYVVETTLNPGVFYNVGQGEMERLLELGVLIGGAPAPATVMDSQLSDLINDVNSLVHAAVAAFPPGPHTHPSTDLTDSGSIGRALLAATAALGARTTLGLDQVSNTSDANKPVSTAQQTALNLKANLASPTFTGTVGGITKAMVGLGSVDNTADSSKPVSTAQRAAFISRVAAPSGVAATDTANIQAALTAAQTAGGGQVLLSAGTYQVNATLIIGQYVALRGAGWRATTLALANGVNGSLLVTPDDGVQRYGVEIRDLGLDGNAPNQTGAAPLIAVHGMNEAQCADLYIYRPRGPAIQTGQATSGMHCTVPMLRNLVIRGDSASQGPGILLGSGSSDAIVHQVDLGFFANGAGLSLSGHPGAALSSVNVWQCFYGFQWYRSDRQRVMGCLSDYAKRHGFIVQESSDFQFDACQAREGSMETADTYDGFRVEGSSLLPARDLSFMGCRAMGSQQRVGIGLINDIGRASVVGGSMAGNAIAPTVEGTNVLEWRYLAVGGKADTSG